MIMEHFNYVLSQVLVPWDIVLFLIKYRFLSVYFFYFPVRDIIQEICGSISLNSFNYVLNVCVQVFTFRMRSCRLTSNKFTNKSSRSNIWSSLPINSSIPWSGHCDRASDCIIFIPGTCTSLMSNFERYSDHQACWSFNF